MKRTLFCDSCGDYVERANSTPHLINYMQDKYAIITTSFTSGNQSRIADGRKDGAAYYFAHRPVVVMTNIESVKTFVLQFAYLRNAITTGSQGSYLTFGFSNSTSQQLPQVSIRIEPANPSVSDVPGGISILVGNSVVAESDSYVITSLNTWSVVSAKFHIDSDDGIIEVKINGKTVVSFRGNTDVDGDGVVNRFVGFTNTNNGGNGHRAASVDDLVIAELTSPEENGFLGNVYVGADTPATTVQAQGTPSDPEANNHEMVNEYGEGAPDEDTTHVALEQGQKDRYGFGPLPTNGKIHAVQLTARYRSQDGGLPQVKLSIESGGQEVSKTDIPEANEEYRYKNTVIANTDPATNEQWTQQAVNDMTVGIEVLDD